VDRRAFLGRAALLGGAAMVGPKLLSACTSSDGDGDGGASAPGFTSILEHPASDAPIDTVVVVMMENRSFDHYFGWLANDEAFQESGRSRYGGDFTVAGMLDQTYRAPDGAEVATTHWVGVEGESDPWRGCGHPDPGHSWDAGRVQRDAGFLADGSGNDRYAIGYYLDDDLPFTSRLATRFTTFDQWHCSVLAPTFPNREYLHSAQSGGQKANYIPTAEGGFTWPTIWDRLAAANVPARYYYIDLPVPVLWTTGMEASGATNLENYFDDAAAGRLPNVVFVDPGFLGAGRTDDHPHADIRAGQRFLYDVFRAFVESPHWEHGAFILTYDEWGGFFDHVAPPQFPDDRASSDDEENFAQAGFRVPSLVASPYARPGYVDHTVMEHTSVLRFLEWRFLGAPATGTGGDGDTWYFTERDRNAYNLGAALGLSEPDPEVDLDIEIDEPTPDCAPGEEGYLGDAVAAPAAPPAEDVWTEMVSTGYLDRMGVTDDAAVITT